MESKALGKGLSALIPVNFQNGNQGASTEDKVSNLENQNKNIAFVDTVKVRDNRLQPRENYAKDKLEELMASIKEKGVLQPILVRRNGDGYEVVAGERRLRAARELKLAQIPVIIKDVTDRESLVLALVENMQREGLNPVEEAKGFKKLVEEFGFTQDGVAQAVGKDRSTVTNLLRLLRLPQDIQSLMVEDKLSVGHARALLAIENTAIQSKMAREIVQKSLSVRQVESLVKKAQQPTEELPKTKSKNRDIQILEEELRRKLGTKVLVEDKKGKGRLVIEYYTLDDLDRILGVLRK